MAFWDGLLGGGGGDEIGLYDELLTDRQKAALRSASSPFSADNLARMSVALAKAAEPSLTPKGGGIASALAAAAGATAGGRDEQVQALLKAGLTAQQAQEIKRRLALQEKIVNSPIYQRVLGGAGAAAPPGMPAGVPGAPSPASPMVRPGPAVAPPPIPDPPVPPGAVPPLSIGNTPQSPLSPRMSGLLGGDTQMAAALPPPDELIPSGEPGVLAALQAAYGGGGAPGLPFPAGAGSDAAPTLRLASADPFLARNALRSRENPQGDPISWQNEWPAAGPDAPADLGETRGRLPANLPPPVMGGTAARPVAGLTGSAWEIANNNFGGLRKPGVVAGPSQGGFQSFDSPEAGVAAISRQLDRYASGATTGKPLTTLREIVSTWAPPHENPTATLIARASRIVGADPDAPLDVSDPQIKAKLIEATIANEQGGRVPVGRDLINSVASRPAGDEVIPSGRGVPASALRRTQAGGGGGGFGTPALPPGFSTPQSGGGLDNPIPGLGASPRELMVLDSLAEMAKMGTPFKGFLDAYYKTPEYLSQAAGATAQGRLGQELIYNPMIKGAETRAQLQQELELKPKIEAEIERLKNAPLGERAENQAKIDRYSKYLEELNKASLDPTEVTVTINGEQRDIKMTRQQAALLFAGKPVPELGLPAMTAATLGKKSFTAEQLESQKADLKILEDKRLVAENARKEIQQANDMRQTIEKGVIAGTGADTRTQLLKLGQLVGLTGRSDDELIRNTEKYIAQQGNNLKAALAGLGPPISNVDIETATKIGGGQNTTAQGMLELLAIKEKYQRQAMRDYNQMVPKAPESRFRTVIPEPPKFGAELAYDNVTGQPTHWKDEENRRWVPMQ